MNTLLTSLQPFGIQLPSIVFFDPLPEFIQYVKNFNQPVIDVGSGMGRMSRLLVESGVHCTAIDIGERDDEEWPSQMADACTYEYPAGSLPIMARPCHGFWTEEAVLQALRFVPVFIYVGLKKNIRNDVGYVRGVTLQREKWKAGRNGEIVVTIKRKI